MFISDTLFAPDVGSARCDFIGGSPEQLFASIQRLLALPEHDTLYLCQIPGHPSNRLPDSPTRQEPSHVRLSNPRSGRLMRKPGPKTWTAIKTGNLDDRSGKLDSDPETRTANTFRSVIGNLASHHIPVGGYPEVPRRSGHFDGCPNLYSHSGRAARHPFCVDPAGN